MQAKDQLLTVREVAELLCVSPQTVRAWIRLGNLHALRIGKKYLVRRSVIDKLLHDDTEKNDDL